MKKNASRSNGTRLINDLIAVFLGPSFPATTAVASPVTVKKRLIRRPKSGKQ